MSTLRAFPVTFAFIALSFPGINAADWPQYRGPDARGISSEKLERTNWSTESPRPLWKAPTLDGFSSLAVGAGKAFTLVGRTVDGAYQEVCIALDANSGRELWARPLHPVRFDGQANSGESDNSGGEGPRSTPAYSEGRVYVLSARLLLACFDSEDGTLLWKRNLVTENSGRNISWENAASPLVEKELVFVAGGGPGQSLLGIDKKTGKVVWKGEDEKMTHASPVAATIAGVRQIIFLTQKGLVGVVPESGHVLWRHPFKFNVSTAASPVVGEDIVFCSAGYGVGSAAVKISKAGNNFAARELWRQPGNKPVANHWSTPVYDNGYLYGMFSFKEYGNGPLKCVAMATGKVQWEQPGYGAGNVILAGGHLIALTDRGDLVLIDPSPQACKEIGRVHAVNGKCWSTPALSDGRLYARSTKEAVCLDLSGRTASR